MSVGDYVRTKNNGIKKILDIGEYLGIKQYLISKDGKYVINNSIIKSSPNIIDLIEVGDYVNGNPVCLIKEDEHNRKWIYTDSNYKYGYLEEDIKSIVTKEMFSQMEYKL